MDTERITARAEEIARTETVRLLERTPGSAALHARAVRSMPMGVASSFQANDPYPVYLAKGAGSRVWDVDGNEYVDFHGGFGVNIVGHAHPKIVDAVSRRIAQGSHFAQPVADDLHVARELARRFGLPQWRFTHPGTESPPDAVR